MKALNLYCIVLLYLVASLPFISSCEKDKKDPAITVTQMTALSVDQYKVSAKITAIGDYKILDHGFVFDFSDGEAEIDFQRKISLGNVVDADTFSRIITNNIYYDNYDKYKCYVKAFITNEKGTVFSEVLSLGLIKASLKSLSVTHGNPGDTIIIYGENFNSNLQSNHIWFNYTKAQVISGTISSLKVIVPPFNAIYSKNPADVTLSSFETLNKSFLYDLHASGFFPHNGNWDNYVTISGTYYDGVAVYFDDIFVNGYNDYNGNIIANVPKELRKKYTRIYIKYYDQAIEVPGGDFRMDDLVIDPLTKWEYKAGDFIYISGKNFHPFADENKLLLSNGSSMSCTLTYTSYAEFIVPSSIPGGTYTARVTNGVDTITLPSQIEILVK